MAPESRINSAKIALLTEDRYALCSLWRQLVQFWPHEMVTVTRNTALLLKIFPNLETIWLKAETDAPLERLLKLVDDLALRESHCHLIVCLDQATPAEMQELIEHGVDEIVFQAGIMAEPMILQKTMIVLKARGEQNRALRAHIIRHQKALQTKSEFLAWLSHEIRTPMNGVLGLLELFPQTGLTAEQQDMLDVMGRSGQRVVDLVSEVLDVSRIEAGKMNRISQNFHLRRLIEDCMSLYARDANQRGLMIGNLVEADVPDLLLGDERKLSQILNNLLSNAVKYTSAGHVLVKVRVEAWEGHSCRLLFEVQDSGHGIGPDEISRVFAPFEQTQSAHLSRSPSSGLGLSLTKKLVELLGGSIHLQSHLGLGSTFSCALPFEVVDQPLESARPHPSSRRAVVISDDPNRVLVLQQMLERSGLSVSVGRTHEPLPDADWYFFGEQKDWEKRHQGLRLDPGSRRAYVLRNPTSDRHQPLENRFTALPQGCEFIDLPLKQSDLYKRIMLQPGPGLEPVSRPIEHARLASTFEGARILVVDDDPVNLKVADKQLKRLKAETTLAASGVDALEWLEKKHFDLIFVDCQMPHMDGFELVKIMRGLPQVIPGTPVIALTALGRDEDREKAIQHGFTDFLAKPAQLEDIQKVLGRWLPSETPAA
ncbi:MAG TPA: response regulator [Oligoflexus sp.]|uniref:response regulator n=1 Tax=Oligoflexus sp. TaxID=1971216 RepID=UPI002D48AC7C|nr:response regulator [Oligoflexus sp.]HYX38726.1 response regulator [Oligoflexus sp.]